MQIIPFTIRILKESQRKKRIMPRLYTTNSRVKSVSIYSLSIRYPPFHKALNIFHFFIIFLKNLIPPPLSRCDINRRFSNTVSAPDRAVTMTACGQTTRCRNPVHQKHPVSSPPWEWEEKKTGVCLSPVNGRMGNTNHSELFLLPFMEEMARGQWGRIGAGWIEPHIILFDTLRFRIYIVDTKEFCNI
jgi:hypothetical protein